MGELEVGWGPDWESVSMCMASVVDVTAVEIIEGELLGISVGGAGIRREVLQEMHVYVTACPCEGEDLIRTVAVEPGMRTVLQPLQSVRFTDGSILTVVF